MEFAQNLEMQKMFPSKLYKDRRAGEWYLLIKKGKLKLEEYQGPATVNVSIP